MKIDPSVSPRVSAMISSVVNGEFLPCPGVARRSIGRGSRHAPVGWRRARLSPRLGLRHPEGVRTCAGVRPESLFDPWRWF